MYSIRRWLYKPKKDDNSILAQFFYADEDLNYVAAELDSFDGRKDPERCTQLVNQLRQCQDKVLNICNQIMDVVIPNNRANRDFRVKFPDDVLQENLAGQLWFGAECLAAGSSIMNREIESASMRPLAKALTKILDNVRNLLREQCLRNPHCYTEKIKETLKIFDRLFAEFELSYVSAMVPVKTLREYDIQQNVIILFSETLQRALRIGLISQDMVDDYDPALMFTIPRLAIVCGLLIYPEGPFNVDADPNDMSEMFRPFQNLLYKIRDLLWTLTKGELYTLEKTLCSVEDPNAFHLKTSGKEAETLPADDDPTNNSSSAISADNFAYPSLLPNIEDYVEKVCLDYPGCKQFIRDFYEYNFPTTTTEYEYVSVAENAVVTIASTDDDGEDDDDDDDEDGDEEEVATEAIADSDSGGEDLTALQESLSDALTKVIDRSETHDSGLHSDTCSNSGSQCSNSGSSSSRSSSGRARRHHQRKVQKKSRDDNAQTEKGASSTEAVNVVSDLLVDIVNEVVGRSQEQRVSTASSGPCLRVSASAYSSPLRHHNPNDGHGHYTILSKRHKGYHSQPSSPSLARQPPWRIRGSVGHPPVRRLNYSELSADYSSSCSSCQSMVSSTDWETDSCSSETSSYNSDCQDDEEIALAIQAAEIATRNKARGRFRSTEDLIHRLFVCISGVADQLQTNYASDLRNILKFVFQMNCSELPEESVPVPSAEKAEDVIPNEADTLLVTMDDDHNPTAERISVESAEEASERQNAYHNELDEPPTWIPDELAPHCMSCQASFTVVRRRHHCRNCGKVFCSRCSSNSVPLPQYGHTKPVRVCNRCFIYQVTPFLIQGDA